MLISYFGTKEQMTIELVDYLLEEYRHGYGDRLAAIADPLERLRAILDTFFDPEYHQLLDDSVFSPASTSACATRRCGGAAPRLRDLARARRDDHPRVHEGGAPAPRRPARAGRHDQGTEEGYAFLIGGGADEAAKAEVGSVVKARALRLLGLPE